MRGSRGMRHLALIGGLVVAACCGVAATAMAGDAYVAWKRQLGTANDDYATGVATDAAGNVYLSGVTDGSLADGNKPGSDAFVAKYAADCHPLWKRQLGTSGYDYATGVATDAAGNVYLAGGTSGSFGGANKGDHDAWVVKYAADGHPLWKRQPGTDVSDRASSVATDAAGNVYLAGTTGGSLGGANEGGIDAFVAKYAADGHLLWTQQLGTADYEEPTGVATDAAGNVYLTGYTWGSLGGANKGRVDTWVAKYAADGQLLWTRQLGTAQWDQGYGVATDTAGNVYLTGYTYGSLGGVKKGGADAWVMKLDTDGHRLWTRQPGTADDDWAQSVATDAAGNVYLTGYTRGSLGGANKGRTDAWVMKISPTAASADGPSGAPAEDPTAEEPTNGPAD